jgi:hypothetical protein
MTTIVLGRSRTYKIIAVLLAVMVTIGSTTACTPAQRTAAIATGGAILGGGAAYAVARANGANSKQALGYGIGGALVGGLAGGLLAQHLNREEQEAYDASMRQSLKQQADNQPGRNTWKNPEGTKQITTTSSNATPLHVASQDARRRGIQVDSNVLANANVSAGSSCRMVETTLNQYGQKPVKESALWCRDPQGDYVRAGGTQVASL